MLFSCIKLIQTFQNDLGGSSTQSSLFIQNSISVDYPLYCNPYCTNILSQFSILAMIYFIMGSETVACPRMDKNGKDTKHTRHIERRMHL